jgi:hypothetical protein
MKRESPPQKKTVYRKIQYGSNQLVEVYKI